MSQHDMIYQPVEILKGGTISTAVNAFNKTVVGFDFPFGFPATNVTFLEKSKVDGEYVPFAHDGAALSLAAIDGVGGVTPSKYAALQDFKIVSDADMTADTVIWVRLRSIS